MLQLAESRKSEALSQYTFKPQVSRRSQRIVLSLGSNFQTRQQTHLERKRMKEVVFYLTTFNYKYSYAFYMCVYLLPSRWIVLTRHLHPLSSLNREELSN